MKNSARTALAAFILLVSATVASAQVISQPTAAPIVTADVESWYLKGEPITYAGNTYYPAGAQVSFNANEMIRSGFHLGVPLYTRTTDEPFSMVYVPLARGFVQPYMRPRTGDMAGTAGTFPPAGAAAMYSPSGPTTHLPMAAGPPTLVAGPPSDVTGQPRAPIPAIASSPVASSRSAAGTAGRGAAAPAQADAPAPAPVPTHTRIGPRPLGLNAIFIQYRDRRWYNEGPAIELDRARMTEVGDYRGFPVFVDRDTPERLIYIATTTDGTLVAPYSERKTH